jgi:PAS domain S-box-containing protein
MHKRATNLIKFFAKGSFLIISTMGFLFFPDILISEEKILQVSLTEEETGWLDSHPNIRIAGPKAFPPFHYYEEQNQKGIGADYSSLIFNSLEVKAEIKTDLPWPKVLELIKQKKIDVIVLLAKTGEREKYLTYTDPYLSFPLVIISRKEGAFIGSLKDLYQKKISCIKKSITCDWLKDEIPSFQSISADTPLEALEIVAYGKADAHIGNLAAASFLIQKEGLSNLKIAAPTSFGNYELYFAVRKDWPILVSILNKSLAAIPLEEKIEIQNKWLTVRYEHGIRLSDVQKWIALIVGTAGLLILITLLWNRRLKKEIAERKIISHALRESEKTFSAIFQLSPISVTISSFETGRYLDANQTALKTFGFSLDEIVGKSMEELDIWNNPEQRKELVKQINGNGTFDNFEAKLKSRDGKTVSCLISGVKVKVGDSPCLLMTAVDITNLEKAEEEQQRLIGELQETLENIKTLNGLLPICASCKKIRDDSGYWNQLESYIEHHSDALFSHGICPDCANELYGKEPWYRKKNQS